MHDSLGPAEGQVCWAESAAVAATDRKTLEFHERDEGRGLHQIRSPV